MATVEIVSISRFQKWSYFLHSVKIDRVMVSFINGSLRTNNFFGFYFLLKFGLHGYS